MKQDTSLEKLDNAIHDLEQNLEDLLWAAVQAQPDPSEGHALVDHYDRITHDAISLVKDASQALKSPAGAVQGGAGPEAVSQALMVCQDRFQAVSALFYDELVGYEWLHGLHELARERRGDWETWAVGVQDALRRCAGPLQEMGGALAPCWVEFTERMWSGKGVTQRTNIGPRIYVATVDGVEAD